MKKAGSSPDFIHIGPGRSGTTYLYEVLKAHPEVYMAKGTKETNYFSLFYDKGYDWYQRFFPPEADGLVKGEVSNRYFYTPECAERIAIDLPGIKLITVLRNPFDRLVSAYKSAAVRGEISAGLGLNQALKQHPELVDQCRIGSHLRRFFEKFSQDQIAVLYYEEMSEAPELFVKKLYRFIEVDESFKPDVLHQKINPAQESRNAMLTGLMRLGADILRKLDMLKTLHYLKRQRLISRIFFKPAKSKSEENINPQALGKAVRDLINQEIDMASEVLSTDLSTWKLR